MGFWCLLSGVGKRTVHVQCSSSDLVFPEGEECSKRNEAMRVLHSGVQKTLLHFLCRDGMRLSVVEFAQEPAFTQTFVNLSVLND